MDFIRGESYHMFDRIPEADYNFLVNGGSLPVAKYHIWIILSFH
jgi:hypothetical protein